MRPVVTAPPGHLGVKHAARRPAAAAAFGLALLVFVARAASGFDSWDESSVWYGVQRVLAGDISLLDVQSDDIGRHDIGRYLWAAPWMLLSGGTGLRAVRLGDAVLSSGGVALAVLLIRLGRRGWSTGWLAGRSAAWLALAALIVAPWTTPRDRPTDDNVPRLPIAGRIGLLQQPARPRRRLEAAARRGEAATIAVNRASSSVIGLLRAIGWLMSMPPRQSPPSGRALLALAARSSAASVGQPPVSRTGEYSPLRSEMLSALARCAAAPLLIHPPFPASAARRRCEIEQPAAANIALPMTVTQAVADRPDSGFER